MYDAELDYNCIYEGSKFPFCCSHTCKNSVEHGGYPGGFSGELYCEMHRGYTSDEFVSLIFDEENFVV